MVKVIWLTLRSHDIWGTKGHWKSRQSWVGMNKFSLSFVMTTMLLPFITIYKSWHQHERNVALSKYSSHYGPWSGYPYNNLTTPSLRRYPLPYTLGRAGHICGLFLKNRQQYPVNLNEIHLYKLTALYVLSCSFCFLAFSSKRTLCLTSSRNCFSLAFFSSCIFCILSCSSCAACLKK